MAAEIYLPKMSDHMEEGRIIHWLVQEGEAVEQGQVIVEIETDKAVGEIEAPASGVLKGVRAGDGEIIPVGETIAFIARQDEEIPALPPLGGNQPAIQAAITIPEPGGTNSSGSNKGSNGGPVRATPVARRVAKELGVDLSKVTGTGPGGRVREEDVIGYASQAAQITESTAPEPEHSTLPAREVAAAPIDTPHTVQAASTLPGEVVPLTQIQQITGQRMLASTQQAPHFFLQVNVDVSSSLQLVKRARDRVQADTGARLSVTAVLSRVVASALRNHPRANASFENGSIRLFQDVNIGVAVGTENGLSVPVIKNADKKSLAEIAKEINLFQAKAEEMRFTLDDLSGGTFTISNLGMFGIDVFTAIINPPQSCILAIGQIVHTPVGKEDGSIEVKPMMALTLSVDHRCMDGLQGAKFLAEIKQLLDEPYLML